MFSDKLLIHSLFLSTLSVFSLSHHSILPGSLLDIKTVFSIFLRWNLISSSSPQWGASKAVILDERRCLKGTASVPRPPSHLHSSDRTKQVWRKKVISSHHPCTCRQTAVAPDGAACAELICKDRHPDDDFSGAIYSRRDPILSWGRVQLDVDVLLACRHL